MRLRFQLDGCISFLACAQLIMVAACLGSLMSLPALAAEGKRVAFVVGIGTYDHLAPDKQLVNPVNDAEGVSAKLQEIGFRVTKAANLTRSTFNKEWQDILDNLAAEDTFILFFSGHGVQIEGENYLLPRDIPFIQYGKQERLKRESISVTELMSDLTSGDRPHPKRAVIILDACRDNPLIPPGYKSIKVSVGLAKPSSTEGLFVIYSALENSVSLDRLPSDEKSVRHSVFTRVLLSLLGRQDLTLQNLSLKLKKDVSTLANNAGQHQLPAYYDGTDGEPFCLPGCAAEAERGAMGLQEHLTTTFVQASSMKEIASKDGAPMLLIPSGEFWMGSPDGEGANDERPRHRVLLDAFYMDKFEVTVARYAEFVQSNDRSKPLNWDQVDSRKHGNLPVVGIDWHDARAYCEWAGKRLPTEAEWEKAARGTDERTYPWGDKQPTKKLANFMKRWTMFPYDKSLASVESYETGKSPYGLHHMAGNVWEWTADWYDAHYYQESPPRNPKGPSMGNDRVLRGGSSVMTHEMVRSAFRYTQAPTYRGHDIGFRCAQDLFQQ